MPNCDCGYEAKSLYRGKCWRCWQTGVVKLGDESIVRLAFYNLERQDVADAKRFFPHLLRGAEEEVTVILDQGGERTMTHFEIASCDDYAECFEKGSRSEAIVMSLRHLNPEWRMSVEEMKWRLSGSTTCKECGSFCKEECEACLSRCKATTAAGKRCPNQKKGRGKKAVTCGVHKANNSSLC